VAGIASNVTTVAGIASNVTSVVGNASNINAVAADASDIGTVAGAISNVNTVAGISSNISTVAGNTSNINTVAGNNSNISTVAGNNSNVSTVAGISSEVTAVAGKATEIGRLGTADAVSDMNTLGTSSNVTNMNTLAGIASDITTTAGIASSISASGTNASNAASSATAAASSATAAAASQTAAAASAASAASAFDNFDDTYLGAKSSNPTQDNDGDSLTEGDLYFNTTANEMRVYDGANWIAATSAGNVSLILYEYTATAGQTTFSGSDDNSATLSYTANNLQVVMNGIVLDPSDFTATNGTSVVLASGAALNDLVNIYAFKSFTTADMVSASAGGTFAGNVDITARLDVDNIRLDGNTISTTSGDMTLDAVGDVVIDADGADIRLKHAGTEWGRFVDSTNNFLILNPIADKDIIFNGIDDSSEITALTLDMSEAGKATFNNHVVVNDRVVGANDLVLVTTDSNEKIHMDSDGFIKVETAGSERLRVDSSGHILVGQSSTITPGSGNTTHGTCLQDGGRLFLSADGVFSLSLNRSDSGELTNFHRAGAFKGSINITASAVSYNTSSDVRLKENIADMTGAIDRVKQLAPKRFNFIEDADNTVDGLLAHETQTVVPEAITGTHNEVDDDGNPVYQQIDQSKLVPLLVGALKESIAKIETLETKVAALESGQ